MNMKIIKCQVCGKTATHHHSGNHFCINHARDYARRTKWKRIMFWSTPNGAMTYHTASGTIMMAYKES